MFNENVKNKMKKALGLMLCLGIVVLRMCSELIGGSFSEFYESASPWLMTGLSVAMMLVCNSQYGKCGEKIN